MRSWAECGRTIDSGKTKKKMRLHIAQLILRESAADEKEHRPEISFEPQLRRYYLFFEAF